LTAFPAGTTPGVGVAGGVALGLGVGVPAGIVAVGLGGGGVVGGMVTVGLGVGVVGGIVDVGVGLGVPGVGVTPLQLPRTLNTRCMLGKPMADVVVGVVIPHAVALR
jgi:hypothetical protein